MLDGNANEPAGVDERYSVATNATSLVVVEHKTGPVDVLAAAAWSPARIGAALLRLHSEFDGGQRATEGTYRTADGKAVVPTDAKLLAMRLRTMPAAREQLTLQARKWEMEDPEEKARIVLIWWLDRRCGACHGRRWKTVKDTPVLSGVPCGLCRGKGESRLPAGQDGKKLASFLDDCVSRARQSIRQRLRQGR